VTVLWAVDRRIQSL